MKSVTRKLAKINHTFNESFLVLVDNKLLMFYFQVFSSLIFNSAYIIISTCTSTATRSALALLQNTCRDACF